MTQSSYVVNQSSGTVTINFAITGAVADTVGTVAITFEDYKTVSGTPTAVLVGSGVPNYTATFSSIVGTTLTYTVAATGGVGMIVGDGPYSLAITGGSNIVNPTVAGNDVTITVATSAPESMTSDITIIPVVTSISPSNRGAGSGTTTYLIIGDGFGNGEIAANGVTVGGQASTGVTYNSVGMVTATGVDVSGLVAGNYDVVVTNNGATGTGSSIFEITAAPTVASAQTANDGSRIIITFSKTMADPAGTEGDFSYTVNGGGAQSFSAAALNATTTTIDLTTAGTAITNGDVVTVSYTGSSVTAADTGVLATFAGQAVTNCVPVPAPTVASAATNTAGTTITITFSKAMSDPAGMEGDFSYTVNGGGAQTFSAAALNADTTKIDLTTSGTAIAAGDVVTVSYTAGTLTAADGGILATFAGQAVTNNMAVTPVAGFTGSPTLGYTPLVVTFTDTSTNTPTSWSWDFGDGTTSTLQNPVHAYSAGTYTVSLTATNSAGSSTSTATNYISVYTGVAPSTGGGGTNSDSDSYSSSSPSGGAVSGTTSTTGSGEEVVLVFDQSVSSTNPVGIYQLEIVPNQQIGGFQMIARPVNVGEALQVQDRQVVGYLQILPVAMNSNVIDHARITFEISSAWLSSNNIRPEDIVLMRYHDNQWTELPTDFIQDIGGSYLFTGTTPGFSYFAITVRPEGTVVTPEPAIAVTETETLVQPFDEKVPETTVSPRSAAAASVTTLQTQAPAPAEVPTPQSPSYLPVILLVIVVAVIAGGFFAWRRHQQQNNPLLFEK